jgi:hypothetical protein
MGRTKECQAAAAALLVAVASLSGCSSPKRPGEVHGHLIQPASQQGPFCVQHTFGDVKSGGVQHSVTPSASEPIAFAADDHPADAGKLLVLDHQLDALPLEIARIQRGMVKRFTGRLIKDGVTAWSALDLDRLVAISVERRVFDFRTHQSRPVADPVFRRIEPLSFARKWSDSQRTEVEVVNVFPITLVEAQLFVCAANPAWADKNSLADVEDETDSLSDGVTDVFLLDHRVTQGLTYTYGKPIDMTENLAGIMGSIWQHAPRGPQW